MRADQLPDFVEPLTVREQGYRVVYEPRALLYEDALAEAGDEFRMRVRVGLRALHALKDKAALLNPLRFGLFAWQLFSHKVLRYLAFLFMAGRADQQPGPGRRHRGQPLVAADARPGHVLRHGRLRPHHGRPQADAAAHRRPRLLPVRGEPAPAPWPSGSSCRARPRSPGSRGPEVRNDPREPAWPPPRLLARWQTWTVLMAVLVVPFFVPIPIGLRRNVLISDPGRPPAHRAAGGHRPCSCTGRARCGGRLLWAALAAATVGGADRVPAGAGGPHRPAARLAAGPDGHRPGGRLGRLARPPAPAGPGAGGRCWWRRPWCSCAPCRRRCWRSAEPAARFPVLEDFEGRAHLAPVERQRRRRPDHAGGRGRRRRPRPAPDRRPAVALARRRPAPLPPRLVRLHGPGDGRAPHRRRAPTACASACGWTTSRACTTTTGSTPASGPRRMADRPAAARRPASPAGAGVPSTCATWTA